jgi:hypothetical protein
MADQHNDDVPAIANVITTDIGKIKETLEYHKDVFQEITTGWSNTSTTNILPKRTVTTYSTETTKTVSSLTETGLYRVDFVFDISSSGYIFLRFNADSGTNYLTLNRYEYDGTSAAIGQTSSTGINSIPITLTYAGIHFGSFIFGASPGDTTRVIVNFRTSNRLPSSDYGFVHGMGYYDGGSALTSFSIIGTQNLTGTMFSERVA